jgi:hypothetical protein
LRVQCESIRGDLAASIRKARELSRLQYAQSVQSVREMIDSLLPVGAAVEGMRPIAELMFADFMGVCLDQIYNHMAKIHFESGGNVKVPMVLTMAVGGCSDARSTPSACGAPSPTCPA